MCSSDLCRLGLLRRSPSFGYLFLATAGSSFGTYLAAVALVLQIRDLTGSGVWVAALLIADFLPIVLIGFLLGPLVDRLSRRRLMIASDLVRFGVFAALPFVGSPEGLVVLAGVTGVATGFFFPAGKKKPVATPVTPASTTNPSGLPTNGSAANTPKRTRSDAIMSRRRESRSTRGPRRKPMRTIGRKSAMRRAATQTPDPVRSRICKTSATAAR